jgi:hypothetical protein
MIRRELGLRREGKGDMLIGPYLKYFRTKFVPLIKYAQTKKSPMAITNSSLRRWIGDVSRYL